jgi:TetR/AcrR family transcriptional repressor of nem operon
MPRAKSDNRSDLVDSALVAFWKGGYCATSIGDLVKQTGVSRSGIYADFGGKDDLFRACLERYRDETVTQAFGVVEQDGAGFEALEQYFKTIITTSAAVEGADIGCLIANSLGQVSPDDRKTLALLDAHAARLTAGFKAVLRLENQAKGKLTETEIDALASFAMISVQGLWGYMRNKAEPEIIRQHSDTLMEMLRSRVG